MKNVWVNEGYAYWQVPRCAGTSMAQWLESAGFTKVDDSTTFHPVVRHFTVMRDPFERYISCLSLAWEQERPGPWPDFLRLVDDHNLEGEGIWDRDGDPHFLSQSRYLTKMPDADLFDIKEIGYLGNWLRQAGFDMPEAPHIRKGSPARIEFARELLSREPVIAHYEADYHILD